MKAHLRHGALAMVLCTIAGSVNAQERLTTVVPEPKAFPTYSIDSNVVYGRMEYSVEMTQATADAKRSFQNFLRRAVIQAFGSEDGNYVITLVVKNGGVEIAKKAISSFTWKNKNFLFFATESSVTSEISFSGRLLDHFPVTNNNNSLQVGLQIQNTKTVALDTATYNKFSDQVSLLKFNLVQPAVEVTPALKVPLSMMASLVDSTDKASLSSEIAMSFITSGSGNPKWVMFPVRGPSTTNGSGKNMLNGLNVTVKLETDPSLVGKFEGGKFRNLDTNNVLQKATVGASAAAVPFETVLNTDTNKQLMSDLVSLDQEKFPAGRSPPAVCGKLWSTLQKYFTDRDTPAIYAAYLDKYDYVLDVPGAKAGCVDQFRGTINNLGISLESVAITK
ncbi:hypothetical protein J5277_29255 [Rhizobium sp. 16-449-1b]|uniref:hypothetical protein n=1 Tax=Rhizobium sp. 16-449-1b TaxID=2819989 RepID=UPI001ADB3998|nr:hypothetical protein [Rhizobium sp. 16-449-1b]MBO9198222.1 hypothetical protein [Rhizobium sp. 16-449-1b]